MIFYDGVHGQRVVLHQLVTDGEEIKLPDAGGGFADAVIQKQIEFQILFAGKPNEIRHIQRFEKGDHGIGSLHPKCIGHSSAGFFGINYSCHIFLQIPLQSD